MALIPLPEYDNPQQMLVIHAPGHSPACLPLSYVILPFVSTKLGKYVFQSFIWPGISPFLSDIVAHVQTNACLQNLKFL